MKVMKIGIVIADFYPEIASEMLSEAQNAAKEKGIKVVAVSKVVGAFDIPIALKRILERRDVNAAVVLGAVVQGETSHDEVVAYTSAEKILSLSLQYNKPVGYGVSGPRMTIAQAKARAKEFARRAVEAIFIRQS
jgi:6,7-dimethyl-8-ribityllumazine synthase